MRSICGLFSLTDFWLLVYSLVDSQKRNKLESMSKKCIFIGFTKGVKGFRLWDPEKKSAFTNRDVVFDEDSMLLYASKKSQLQNSFT